MQTVIQIKDVGLKVFNFFSFFLNKKSS